MNVFKKNPSRKKAKTHIFITKQFYYAISEWANRNKLFKFASEEALLTLIADEKTILHEIVIAKARYGTGQLTKKDVQKLLSRAIKKLVQQNKISIMLQDSEDELRIEEFDGNNKELLHLLQQH